MDSQGRTAIVLFRGDPRREERQKRLPRRFLSALHDALLTTIGGLAGTDVLIARDTGNEFRVEDGHWQLDSLAARIEAAIAYAFSRGYSHVLLLAGDVAGVTRGEIIRSLQTLARSSRTAAVGLSGDGGFYAAGFSQVPTLDWQRLLLDRSNTGAALTAALIADGFSIEPLPIVDDIDNRADAERLVRLRRPSRAILRLLARLASMLRRRFVFPPPSQPPFDAVLDFSSTLRGPPQPCRPL
jgi:glycosyltransferase A (GT-A) superfamily protein (DUF2064 family)